VPRYTIAVHPSHNRVYASAAPALTAAELSVLAPEASDVEVSVIAGVDHVTFTSDRLPPGLGRLSGLFAAYELVGELLAPVEVPRASTHDDDLVTIQRYAGKTNESFTKLLLNVTAAAAHREPRDLLDPLAGRGTTLNVGLLHGLDVAGIELNRRDVEMHAAFLLQWLRDKRYKHSSRRSSVNRKGKPKALRVDIELAPDKAAPNQRAVLVADDTRYAMDHFGAGSFDLVVADLPYGVQHGSRTEALARSPADLLGEALPVWTKLMRRGGAVGIAFNALVLDPSHAHALVAAAGLQPFALPAFQHRVDASIVRDLVVATRP